RHRARSPRRRPAEPDARHHPADWCVVPRPDVLRRVARAPRESRRTDLWRIRRRGPRHRTPDDSPRDRRRRALLRRPHRPDCTTAARPQLEVHSMETTFTPRRLTRRRALASLAAVAAVTLT